MWSDRDRFLTAAPVASPMTGAASVREVARYRDVVCMSDKPVDQVLAYSVRFSDGSWANLLSRSYRGTGDGRVFFLDAPRGVVEAPSRRERFGPVDMLFLRGSCADVVVEATEGDSVVEVQGDSGFCSTVSIEEGYQELQIRWRACTLPPGPGDPPRLVRCRVPAGCEVDLDAHASGRYWITVSLERLRAALGGDCALVCQETAGLDLDLNGSGSALVCVATGGARLRANCSGSGIVAGGLIQDLDAAVRSTGSLVIYAKVCDGRLRNSGSGALVAPEIERHRADRQGPAGLVEAGPALTMTTPPTEWRPCANGTPPAPRSGVRAPH